MFTESENLEKNSKNHLIHYLLSDKLRLLGVCKYTEQILMFEWKNQNNLQGFEVVAER